MPRNRPGADQQLPSYRPTIARVLHHRQQVAQRAQKVSSNCPDFCWRIVRDHMHAQRVSEHVAKTRQLRGANLVDKLPGNVLEAPTKCP